VLRVVREVAGFGDKGEEGDALAPHNSTVAAGRLRFSFSELSLKKRERLALIVSTLALQGRTSSEHLAHMLDARETTIYSDVRTLRRAGVPIHGEPGPGGGFALRPDHTASDIGLTPRDAILLAIAAGILLSRPPVPAGAAMLRAAFWRSVRGAAQAAVRPLLRCGKDPFRPADTPDVSLYADLPELLTNAILAKATAEDRGVLIGRGAPRYIR